MERRPRRNYTAEFKVEAVRLIEREGQSANQVAQQLDISPKMLRRWQRVMREQDSPAAAPGQRLFPGHGRASNEFEETLAKSERALAIARMELEVLKKALGIMAAPAKPDTR